jgi:hypothetical protein
MARLRALLGGLLALAAAQHAAAYYVPGTYPMEFYAGDVLQGGSGQARWGRRGRGRGLAAARG